MGGETLQCTPLTLSHLPSGCGCRQGAIDLPPVMPAVTTESPAPVLSLAKHLQAVGAQMYGAFWCSHCYEQKQVGGWGVGDGGTPPVPECPFL